MADKDFTVVVDGRKIRTQRQCLEEKSDYFKALFSSGLRESVTNSVKMQNIDVTIIRQIISYCETDDITVYDENAYQLWEASVRLLIESLKLRVEQYLLKNLSPKNVAATFNFSMVCNAKHIREACIMYVCSHFEQYLPHITNECYELIKCILSSEFVHRDENIVYKAAMAACAGRDPSDLSDLMEMLFLDDVTSPSESLSLYRTLSPKDGHRKSCETVGVVTDQKIIYFWDRRCLKFKRMTTLPIKHAGVMMERYFQYLYLVGGESRIGFGNWNMDVYRYNTLGNEWETFASMSDCLRSCRSVVTEKKIFFFHGYGKYRIDLGESVVALDLESREWTKMKYTFREAAVPCRALIYHRGNFYHLIRTSTIYKFTEDELALGSGTVISMDGIGESITIAHAFSRHDYVVAIGCKNELIIWDTESNEAHKISRVFHDGTILHCKVIDDSLFVLDEKLYEFEIDFKMKNVRKVAEHKICDGAEPLNACGICLVPFY